MKISAVRKINDNINHKTASTNNNNMKIKKKENIYTTKKRQRKVSTTSSSSYCSICSRSGSESCADALTNRKVKKIKMKRKRTCVTRLENQKEETTSSDTEFERDEITRVSVEDRNQKCVPQCDILQESCASSSDNEIPELINAAIKCVENYTEVEHPCLQPSKQYTSTLLHDFMIKTQMVGNSPIPTNNNETLEEKLLLHIGKRKRGRPRKSSTKDSDRVNFSPESSGFNIMSSPLSPSAPANNCDAHKIDKNSNENSEKCFKKNSSLRKINVVSLDKQTYPIERILYPPRVKRKSNNRADIRLHASNEDSLDPLWKKIDVNLKFRRPSLSGYKSDGGVTVCSKVLAARSGYISDYSSAGNRIYAGYKSDASSKSRFSLNSYISRAKSCSYRTRHFNKKYKYFKRRNSCLLRGTKSIENIGEQDILQLAGLSLGQSSEESSKESNCTAAIKSPYLEKYGEINQFLKTDEYGRKNGNTYAINNTSKEIANLTCGSSSNSNYTLPEKRSFSYIYQNYLKRTKSRLSSTLSQCTTLTAVSKFQLEKRKKARLKCIKYVHVTDPKLNAEIEVLTDNLSTLHLLGIDRTIHTRIKEKQEREKITGFKLHGKKVVKKKRNIENSDHYVLSNVVSRRRHKRNNNSNQDEHKLPLKKRHYLLTPGEKSSMHIQDYKWKDTALDLKPILGKSTLNNCTKVFSKAITPKKRHLLQSSIPSEDSINVTSKSITSSIYDLKCPMKSIDVKEAEEQKDYIHSKTEKEVLKKSDIIDTLTAKVNNIDNLSANTKKVSKIRDNTTNFLPLNVIEPSTEFNVELYTKSHSNPFMKSEINLPMITESKLLENNLSQSKFNTPSENGLNKSYDNVLLKRKRRKTFNRTGFPTVKKKKRKIIESSNSETKCVDIILGGDVNKLCIEELNCDRVPRLGETSDIFLQRHGKPRLSVVSLEKLQAPIRKYRDVYCRTNSKKLSTADESVNISTNYINSVSENEINGTTRIISSQRLLDRGLRYRKNVYCRNQNNKDVLFTNIHKDSEKKFSVDQKISTLVQNTTINNNSTKKRVISLVSSNSQMKSRKTQIPNATSKFQHHAEIFENSSLEELEQEPLPINQGSENLFDISSEINIKKRTTKWKKTSLIAGLFSNFYKINRKRKHITSNDNVISNEINNENGSNLLPPPPYCEKFFRKTILDFLLPYDIWMAYQNLKFSKKVIVPSWNYKKIRANVYGDVRPNPITDHQACNCNPQSACGEDCLNRMVYTECSPSNCPCGDRCQNQKIQKHEIAPGIERFMTENKGWGVRTNLPIKKGTYILEYVGEVVTENEFKERMATLYANDTHHYCLHLDGGLVIDGHRMGSDGRFVNHSCSPNCEMQKWSVNGLFRMALFAMRNIQAGEELTYDYNFSLFNPSEGQPCRCDTPLCRGVIGGKSQRLKPVEVKVCNIYMIS